MGHASIHESAIVKNCKYTSLKAYRNTLLVNSEFGNNCTVGDDTTIERSSLEGHIAINRRSYINDSSIGAFTYTGINTTVNFSHIGRFCSIGRNVDIGGVDHDYHRITTLSEERFIQLSGLSIETESENTISRCSIGNDVWIAAGAQILNPVKIGDGAVIGAGAIVTHDVPPYAIAVGVPARVIGYRCNKQLIDVLLSIQWWGLPIEVLKNVGKELSQLDITEENIIWLNQLVEENK